MVIAPSLHSTMPNTSSLIQERDDNIAGETKEERFSFSKKLLHLPRVLFSRESAYRGLIETFALDLPSALAAATRNKIFFLENIFESFINNFIVYTTPSLTRMITASKAKLIFNDSHDDYANYMLFSRKDLEDKNSFDKARERIIKDEVSDKESMAGVFTNEAPQESHVQSDIEDIKRFMTSYQASDELRKKILKLKDEVIKSQSLIEGFYWGMVPFVRRLFRRFVLGQDRFTGTLAYLNNQDNNKLGNEKGFTLKQILGTVLSIVASPFLTTSLLKLINNKKLVASSTLVQTIKKEMDTTHSFYPKLGLFVCSGEFSFLLSRVFNAQDVFEMLENILEFMVSGVSLLLGDRITNGLFAKSADRRLQQEFATKPGILYKNPQSKPGTLLYLFDDLFPRAAKFNKVVRKTQHNHALQQKAEQAYSQVFYKGFATHGLLTFAVNIGINLLTRYRVSKALNLTKATAA